MVVGGNSPAFLFLPFSSQKEGQHAHLELVTSYSFHVLDKLEVHVAGWGTTSGFSGNAGVSRNLVILSPSLFPPVLLR